MQNHVARPRAMKRGRMVWFVALWCLGVAGAFLLALPFEVLMRMATR
jgi:hypothetical protein